MKSAPSWAFHASYPRLVTWCFSFLAKKSGRFPVWHAACVCHSLIRQTVNLQSDRCWPYRKLSLVGLHHTPKAIAYIFAQGSSQRNKGHLPSRADFESRNRMSILGVVNAGSGLCAIALITLRRQLSQLCLPALVQQFLRRSRFAIMRSCVSRYDGLGYLNSASAGFPYLATGCAVAHPISYGVQA